MFYGENTKTLEHFWLKKTDKKMTLNSMNAFILSLVIYFMGSRLKILMMSWYTSIKPF